MCDDRGQRGIIVMLAAWIGLAVVGATLAAEPGSDPPAQPRRPCILLILADGLGYGDVGSFGQRLMHTPNLDVLAAQAIRFTNFHAGAATLDDARAVLLSGQSAARFSHGRETLAETLKAAGYQTALIGYWGLGGFESPNAPQRRGFDVVITYGDRRHARDLYTEYLYRVDPLTGFEDRIVLAENRGGQRARYVPDLLTDAAVRFCQQNKPEHVNGFRPFFLVVSYPVPEVAGAGGRPAPAYAPYGDRAWPAAQRQKADAISQLDTHIGRILGALNEEPMALNTLVIVAGTLGPSADTRPAPDFFESTGPFALKAGPLAEGTLRVPLLVQWPFWIREMNSSDVLLQGGDIAPTLLEAAGVELPEGFTGISFLPTLKGQTQTNQHTHLLWSRRLPEDGLCQAVRQDGWKLLRQGQDKPWRLYDLQADPAETRDVSDQHPEVVKRLAAFADGNRSTAAASTGSP